MATVKDLKRFKIKARIRSRVSGTAERPRMSVFRSNKEIYVQLVDDLSGTTLLAASSKEKGLAEDKGPKVDVSRKVGKLIAERAKEAGLTKVVFDRNGYLYHGRVKALAEGAREEGLQF
jgi:large subunit ribosomal protein L18